MRESLEKKFRKHEKGSDGLLSLISAEAYNSEAAVWERHGNKQDEKSRMPAKNKRKLREMQQEEDKDPDGQDYNALKIEGAREGLKRRTVTNKKDGGANGDYLTFKKQQLSTKEECRKEKTEKKKTEETKREAKELMSDKIDVLKAKTKKDHQVKQGELACPNEAAPAPAQDAEEEVKKRKEDDMVPIDISGLDSNDDAAASAQDSVPSSSPESLMFDMEPSTNNSTADVGSAASSVSSTVAAADKSKQLKIPSDTTALRARLAAKIEALRAARKADGVNGKPIRTREELIEQRRQTEVKRRARKKEMRRMAKEEEDRKREAALASARKSPGGFLSPIVGLHDHDKATVAGHYAFGRVAFADGTQMSYDLSYEKAARKKKGPMDPKSALAKFQNDKKRIASMEKEKRKEVLEKEKWLVARKRAEGEKVHDDEALLKKTVKRKERAKKKSEKAWGERNLAVDKSIRDRQRKREENIRKRKKNKLTTKGKKRLTAAKKNRPGFEGGGYGGRK